jgi:uncharacterized protein YrrD
VVSTAQDDLGPPASYLTLEEGAAVMSSDGERIGRVEEVYADTRADVFDGIVIGRGPLGLDRRYVEADQIDRIHERGVVLSITAAAAAGLPEPRREAPGAS